MKFTLLVSIYLALKAGNTSLYQWPQTGQATEAYSNTVTFALGFPSRMSSGIGAADLLAPCPHAASAGASSPRVTRRLLTIDTDIRKTLQAIAGSPAIA